MALPSAARKRKLLTKKDDSQEETSANEELSIGDLEINVSDSETGSEGEHDASENADEDAFEVSDAEEDELESDEIPSDAEEGKKKHLNGVERGSNRLSDQNGDDREPNYTITKDANGNDRYMYKEIDPVYDSDDSDAPAQPNTIGNIPLSFYDSYPHIGYDINGKRIMRPAKGEALDALLDTVDIPKGWTGLTDPATGKPLELSQEELEILRKIQMDEIPEEGYDPYPVSGI